MFDIVAAELMKLRKRSAVWVLLAAAVVLGQIFRFLIPYMSYLTGDTATPRGEMSSQDALATTLPDQLVINTIGGFPVFAGALAMVLGALMFGGEYGWGTVKTIFTQGPRRVAVLAGQLIALAVAVLVGVVVMFALSAASSATIALVEGQTINWPSLVQLGEGFGVGWLVLFMWASLGAALGVTLRGVALPIGLGVVWALGIENLISAMAGSVLTALQPLRDVLPGVNAGSLVSAVSPEQMIAPAPGVTSVVGDSRALITLVAYCVVCAAVAAWSVRRRDVV